MPKTPKKRKRVYEVTMLIEDTEFKGCCDDCRWFSPRFIAEAIKDQFSVDKCRIKNLKIRRVKA